MTYYIAIEIIKVLAWIFIFYLILKKRSKISVHVFWLSATSAVLMGIAGLHDLWNFEHLPDKSGFWFIANIFILLTYFIMIKTSCKFYNNTRERIADFLNKLERDNKNINNGM